MSLEPAEEPKESQSEPTPYIKYSNLGFQLIAAVLVGYFLGNFLDHKFNPDHPPYLTASLILIFLSVYMYRLIRELSK